MSYTMQRIAAVVRPVCAVALVLLLTGCASTPGRTAGEDPWQKVNRGVYKFNDTVDRATLKPVAKGYQKITPRWFRAGVGNFFSNLTYPATVVNQFLQGKARMGFRDAGRFLVNSTAGIGGLLDVATRMGLEANDEDFGQTLAVWGVGSGPFVNLPLFGPSSLRDAPSRAADYFLGPLTYIEIPWEVEWGLRGVDIIHSRSELLSLDDTLARAFDPYAFVRDAWIQRREFLIYDGNPPPENLEEEGFEEEPADGSVPASASEAKPVADPTK